VAEADEEILVVVVVIETDEVVLAEVVGQDVGTDNKNQEFV